MRGPLSFGLCAEAVDETTHVVSHTGEVDAVTAPHLGRRLLCPNETVLRPFQVTGLVDRMPIFPSREAAIGGLAAA